MYEKKVKKKKYITLYIIVILLIIGLFLSYKYYSESLEAISSKDEKPVNIDIPSGSSIKDIGEILEDNNLIKDKWVFLLKIKISDIKPSFKAGNYDLNKSMDLEELIASLVKGGKSGDVITFTIPEGYEIKDIAEKLDEEGIIDLEKFLALVSDKGNFENEFIFLKDLGKGQSLEGFLFPSTYEVYESHDESDVIKKMLEGFEKVYEKEIEEKISDIGLSLNEIVTFASIVEREARVDKERPMMAGVIYNRLDIDMPLQVDATVQYALKERKERLLYKDLEIESPYNTYIHNGLPPGPIASPGKESLIATMNPLDVDYFFYVLKKDESGEHIFTKTYEEHKKAIQKK